MTKVALVKGASRSQNIHDALSLIREEVKESIKGRKKVLIKPNLTAIDNICANTNIKAVEVVIDFINSLGNMEIIVGESSGSAYYDGKTTWDVFKYCGYDKLEKYPNVELMDLDKVKDYTKIPVKTIHGNDEAKIIKPPCDYSISLAIPKTHDYAIATLSLKNMMGLVAKEDKLKIHGITNKEENVGTIARLVLRKIEHRLHCFSPQYKNTVKSMLKDKKIYKQNVHLINKNLCTLIKQTKPNLAIIDGYYGMEGDGPIYGEIIKHGIAIASLDAVKADVVASICMGFNPKEIGYLNYCALEKLGSIVIDDIIGVSPQEARIKYKPHRLYEYQKDWK